MKQLLSILFLSILVACKKDDVPLFDNTSNLSLDSLKTLSSNIPNAVYPDLTFINETTGFAVTQGFIVKTTDGGSTWTSINLPINTPPKKIQFTDSQTGYIIGGDNTFGVLLKTTDGGQNWTVHNLNTLECPYGMYFLNNNTGFITGKNLFIKTTDGGQNWTSLKSNGFRMFQDINFGSNNTGYATCNNGVYFKTSNSGISWDSLRYNTTSYLYDIYFTGNKTLVRQGWGSDTLVDFENNYTVIKIPSNATKFLFLNEQKCIGIGSHYENPMYYYPNGDILITNDGWKTFSQKTFATADAVRFTAMAKMNENKIMILSVGLSGTKVIILNQ
jgi:photosystem II stability/assembly factor-like uncharacterized protein